MQDNSRALAETLNVDGASSLKTTRHRYQKYGDDPISVRETDHYQHEYVESFVDKWDELIDWEGRAASEGQF